MSSVQSEEADRSRSRSRSRSDSRSSGERSSLCSELDSRELSDDGDYLLDIASCLRLEDGESITQVLAETNQRLDTLNKLFYKLIGTLPKK